MDPATFKEFAENHRSQRSYKSKPIDNSLLESIIQTGLRASTSGNMQSWSVVATTDPAIKQALYRANNEQQMVLDAPCVLTFCSDFNRIRRWIDLSNAGQSFDDILGFLTGMGDAMIAAQNVALAAESHGLGICYMGTTLWNMEEVSTALSLPNYVVPVTGMVVGYTENSADQRLRLPLNAVLHRERYEDRSDAALLDMYSDTEAELTKRAQEHPRTRELMEKYDIHNKAAWCTAPFAYSKPLHRDTSRKVVAFLEKQGFWNF